MKEMIRYGFILAVICIVASGLLAMVNSLTHAKIIAQAQAEEEAGLKQVIPSAVRFEPVTSDSGVVYYKAYDSASAARGVVFKASAKGYSSTIDTLVGMASNGTVIGIKILSQNETPGLGTRVAEAAFTNQFINKKDISDVQTISGATISSRAVIESVKRKADEIKKILQ
ncbi:MAG: RnfABCDGE type electron transport complex subunit G [Candidatus Omnitrophica bacterium]|nr:RnfABCDGE type electron transport complex subunit G [Candidatus Omnitrophota bacterium]